MRVSRKSVAALMLLASPLPGQSYDPKRESPLTLLVAPADGLAYQKTRATVRELLAANRAAEAEPLAERIVAEYPRDGSNWLLLGSVKRALGKHAEAAEANERAGVQLGSGLTEVPFFRAARDHLAAGNRRAALDLLRREVFERGLLIMETIRNTPELEPLRDDPEFREIFGQVDTTGWSRDYGWRRDIQYLRDEIMRAVPEYHGRELPPEFERQYAELTAKVPQLTDEGIYVGLNRLLAVLRLGHTRVSVAGKRFVRRSLPFQLWAFPEGLFVIHADKELEGLVGSRLVSIEGVAAEEVLRRVNETQSVDGDNEYLLLGSDFMRNTTLLKGLGVIKSADTVRVVLQRPGSPPRTVALATGPTNFTLSLVPPKAAPTPLFLQNQQQVHWDTALVQHAAHYVALNNVLDDKDETLVQFGKRLRTVLSNGTPQNLILDLRHNTGGTTANYPELLRTIVSFSTLPGRRVYVLLSRVTYSAAANLITDLERLADPVFVGEASSECCALNGDPTGFSLPYSGLRAQLSVARWNLSGNVFDGRKEISPHVPVIVSAKDYFAGRDPVMDAVYKAIGESGSR